MDQGGYEKVPSRTWRQTEDHGQGLHREVLHGSGGYAGPPAVLLFLGLTGARGDGCSVWLWKIDITQLEWWWLRKGSSQIEIKGNMGQGAGGDP